MTKLIGWAFAGAGFGFGLAVGGGAAIVVGELTLRIVGVLGVW